MNCAFIIDPNAPYMFIIRSGPNVAVDYYRIIRRLV
jgi:hypothetical protein